MDKKIAYQFNANLRAETTGEGEERKKIIRGYPILFDSPAKIGAWTEYVRKGAFDGVDLSDLILLWQHNTNAPLARKGINMRAEVDETGLFIEAELPETTTARNAYELVSKKIVDGMSYWFDASDVKVDSEAKTIEILKFEWVREVSVVTFPAYPETVVMAFEPENKEKQTTNKLLF